MSCRAKSAKKTFFVRRFLTIFKQKCSNLRPLLSIIFPQGFRISKNIGHPTLGSGDKKTFKRYLKSEHTHRQTDGRTDRQTDISTYRTPPPSWKMSKLKQKSSSKSLDFGNTLPPLPEKCPNINRTKSPYKSLLSDMTPAQPLMKKTKQKQIFLGMASHKWWISCLCNMILPKKWNTLHHPFQLHLLESRVIHIVPEKLSKIHFHAGLFSTPCRKVLFLLKSMGHICPLDWTL